MNLPYVRKPEYLSPSSLSAFERNPLEFYFNRCGPPEYRPPRLPQTFPMAVGSAFDAHVKRGLAEEIGCKCPTLEELITRSVEPRADERQVAIQKGRDLYLYYRKCGAFDDLVKEAHWLEVELEPGTQHVPGTDKLLMGRQVAGVPIMGRPDAMIIRNEHPRRTILDWKVTGAGSGASPHPGYNKLYDLKDPSWAQHSRCGEPMDTLNPHWATQLAMYSWLMRPGSARSEGFQDVHVAIDQVVCSEKKIRVATFRTHVTAEFQQDLRTRLAYAWQKIQDEKVYETDKDIEWVRLML